MTPKLKEQIHVIHVQSHGLLKDPPVMYGNDNGGQLTYLLGAAKAQKQLKEVGNVHILTRKVSGGDAYAKDGAYTNPTEQIGEDGPIIFRHSSNSPTTTEEKKDTFLKKEDLWPTLPEAADNLVKHINKNFDPEDKIVLQLHYADAGFVGAMALEQLRKTYPNLVTVFVGHSLGHDKFEKKLKEGKGKTTREDLEREFNMSTRIAAEKTILKECDVVVTNSDQELNTQYAPYKEEVEGITHKLPVWAGIDSELFHPNKESDNEFEECLLGRRIFGKDPLSLIGEKYESFTNPDLPPVVTVCRPDDRKNVIKLVEAFANDPELYENHNLVLVLGSRPESGELTQKEKAYFEKLKAEIDKYPSLKGKIVCPSQHDKPDISKLMRWAAEKKGVFVNPALTEPFGLTILEAGACGLPVVATQNGGPSETIPACKHGVVVDPYSSESIAFGILKVLDKGKWEEYSKSGLQEIPERTNLVKNAEKVINACKSVLENRAGQSKTQVEASTGASQKGEEYSTMVKDEDRELFLATFENTRKEVCQKLGLGERYVRRPSYYDTSETESESEQLTLSERQASSAESLASLTESLASLTEPLASLTKVSGPLQRKAKATRGRVPRRNSSGSVSAKRKSTSRSLSPSSGR